MAWNPTLYLSNARARLRPAVDLMTNSVPLLGGTEHVSSILDLGCGPGNMTHHLCNMFPNAVILGLDSSPEMIEAASKFDGPGSNRASFKLGDMTELAKAPSEKYYDLVYSNAALHWSQDQFIISRILKNLVTPKTGVLAVQMPDTRVQPSHTLMEVAARNCGFSKAIESARIPRVEYDPDYYFRMVSKQSRDIDMWSTEYIHQLQISPESMNHPVCTFTSATGLRPILDSIEHSGTETNNSSGGNGGTGKDRVNTFLAEYNRLLYEAYPVVYSESNNVKVPMVIFPFKRFFLIVAKL